MSAVRSNFLRAVIALDAAACGVLGLGLAAGGAAVAGLLGLPLALTQPVGLFLIGYAGLLAWLALRPSLPRAVVWCLVGFNVLWAMESVLLVVLGWVHPTALGMALVVGQGLAALVVADLQFLSLRRARAAA
ncbi:hypothetical protein [Phenylobacterium zucineum]|uniref:hypothetical protein n=1 Tax=Phenylobacterium zucineum TaxID=284016 RepID=UPI0002FD0DC6|nr:hypothetical protein [Phenylobacterium zucineum]